MFYVRCNDISVIYVKARRCAGGLKRKLCLNGLAPNAIDIISGSLTCPSKHRHRANLFSSPEPKAQVSYCHSAPSVVHPSVVRPSSSVRKLSHFRLLLWNRWTEFKETWQEARSQCPLPSLCFSGRSEKQDGRPGLWVGWDIFDFSSETAELEFNETLQEARSQRPLPSLCFSGRSEKQNGRPGLWLAETFLTSPLKPLNGIRRNLIGSKISMPSTKFVFFGLIGKTRWPPWRPIGWDIFDFSSETAERNSTKLYRKQDLNALYQVCVFFRADRKNKMAALASDWLRHFWLLLNGIHRNLIGSKISTPSTKFVFFWLIGKTIWPPWPLIGWDIFDFSSETTERNSKKLDRKQDLNALYQVCVFRADQKNKMAAPASDWLRHFQLLLWNCWTEYNETWQEAISQRPHPILCFSGRSEKQNGRHGLWLAETFSTSPLKPDWNSPKLDRKQDLNALYKVCVFQADPKNNMAALASDWLRHILTFPLKPLNGIQQNLTGSKILTSSTKFVFFGPKSE